jgi:hypothetical protein
MGTITEAARNQLEKKHAECRRLAAAGAGRVDDLLASVEDHIVRFLAALGRDEEVATGSDATRVAARICVELLREIEHDLGGPHALTGSHFVYLRDGKGRAATAAGWLTTGSQNRDPAAQARVMRPLRSLRYSSAALAEIQARGAVAEHAVAEEANRAAAFVSEYHAGHLIADTLGGSGGEENLVPLERRLNLSWGRMAEILVEARVREADRDPSKGVHLLAQAVYSDDYPAVGGSAAAYLDAMSTIPDRIDYIAFERVGNLLEPLANESFHSGQVAWFLPLRKAATPEMIADFQSSTFNPRDFVEKYQLRSR